MEENQNAFPAMNLGTSVEKTCKYIKQLAFLTLIVIYYEACRLSMLYAPIITGLLFPDYLVQLTLNSVTPIGLTNIWVPTDPSTRT